MGASITREDAAKLIEILKGYVDQRLSALTKPQLTATTFEQLYMETEEGGTPLDQGKFREYIRLVTANLKGDTGEAGKSAYEQAVEGGYQGTEQEFKQILATAQTQINDLSSEIDDLLPLIYAGL